MAARATLDRVAYGERHDSPVFRDLNKNARLLHEAPPEVIDALPVEWRRHILGHFLL